MVPTVSQPPSGDQMTNKQINLKLPDDLWLAAKVKAAQNRVSALGGDPRAAQGVGGLSRATPVLTASRLVRLLRMSRERLRAVVVDSSALGALVTCHPVDLMRSGCCGSTAAASTAPSSVQSTHCDPQRVPVRRPMVRPAQLRRIPAATVSAACTTRRAIGSGACNAIFRERARSTMIYFTPSGVSQYASVAQKFTV